jgi:hypothetical protein
MEQFVYVGMVFSPPKEGKRVESRGEDKSLSLL